MDPARVRQLLPAEVVSTPGILGGMPCVVGTRVPAATILACLEAGESEAEIFRNYPTLPSDGIEAARAWAEAGRPGEDRTGDGAIRTPNA